MGAVKALVNLRAENGCYNMISGLGDDEGCAGFGNLPERLAERAARVTDDPLQLSLFSFSSPESRKLCRQCRKHLVSEREIREADLLVKAGRAKT